MDRSSAAKPADTYVEGAPAPVPAEQPMLDLSRLGPPAALDEVCVEEITIDGICGVY